MLQPMTLVEVVAALATLDDKLTIYVSTRGPLAHESPAVVELEPEGGRAPAGMRYVLEVPLAKEVLAVWREWRGGREPDPVEATEAIIYYADHDAYLPTV
jgi:hypothetical protein